VRGDGKPGAARSGTPGLGGRVQATYLSQGRITRCALTSPILSSAITRRQDTEAYLSVLYPAIRRFGVPEILVSDNGAVFLSHDVRKVYEALGVEKKEIKKGKPYQNYIEATFGVQRRMADWNFEKAQTYEDLLAAHEKWLLDYNHQKHMAHESRDDNCHSPAAVLNWQRGMQPAPELVYRAFAALGETRVLNKAGYAKFRNFLLYGEQGLAGRETLINIFQDTLAVEYGDYPLSKYSVEWQPDDRHLLRVGNPRLYHNPYQNPQLPLWEPDEVELSIATEMPAKRKKKKAFSSLVCRSTGIKVRRNGSLVCDRRRASCLRNRWGITSG
jgi:putative transposase